MHSWRVLILPFMEQQTLYDLYNFAEPWDGPNNRRLIGMMALGYACPSHRDSASGLTDYFVLVGPATVFPGARSTTLADVKDGPDGTLLLVEASNLAVPWTQPQDLDTSAMSFNLNDPRAPSPSSWHPRGVNATFANGRRARLPFGTSPDRVKAMSARNGELLNE